MAVIFNSSSNFQSLKLPSSARMPMARRLTNSNISMASNLLSNSGKFGLLKKQFTLDHQEPRFQVTHSMPPEKQEIFKSLDGWAKNNVLVHLKSVEKSWQPQDFLPDPTSPDEFTKQVKELRERAKEIPDDYFVMLVGDMITEEALSTYQSMFNTTDGIRDETCSSLTSWATWVRGWTAEGNRHGDLLNKYLYLSGRVDMKQIEKTVQYLIGFGMARVGLASDEKRHETVYTMIMEKLFEVDPDGSLVAFADMMKKKIAMPAHWIYDGRDDDLFRHISAVAQRLGVYTTKDYGDTLECLVDRWNVEKISTGLSGEGRKAQDYVCGLAPKLEGWRKELREGPSK